MIRHVIGRLIYLTLTRLDISYPVNLLSQFMPAPCRDHYDAALRVLGYLKGRPGQGLFPWVDCDLRLYAFCDSDWASCPFLDDRFLGSSLLSVLHLSHGKRKANNCVQIVCGGRIPIDGLHLCGD